MQIENKEYNFVDFMKFFFMICVIAIHSHIENIFGRSGWYITHCIFRLEKSGGGLKKA